jgi:hypothetical protein
MQFAIKKHHHTGLVLHSKDPQWIPTFLESYATRFANEFLADEQPRVSHRLEGVVRVASVLKC